MKKKMCLGLSVAMTLSLLAGCGGNGGSGADNKNPNTPDQPAVTTTEVGNENQEASGKVMLYSSMQESQLMALRDAFQKKYPKVKMEYYFAGTSKVVTKIATEAQAGQVAADVIWVGDAADYVTFKEDGILAQYSSPEATPDVIDPSYVDPEGYYTAGRLIGVGIGYNTTMVSEEEAPKTWNDLLDPKWKNQIVMSDPSTAGTTKFWMNALMCDEKYGDGYMQKLFDNECKLENGTNPTHTQIAAGAYKVGVCIDYVAANLTDGGSPIAFLYPAEDTVSIPSPIGLVAGAENEENGKLLYDFLLSKEGQEILVENNLVSVRKDVEQPDLDLEEITKKALVYDMGQMAEKATSNLTTFNQIFGLA